MPGPAILLTFSRSISSGRKIGVFTALGIATGDLVHTVLVVVGLSAVVATSPALFWTIKTIGAAYLIFIGVKMVFSASEQRLHKTAMAALSPKRAYLQAVVIEVLNPKTALFFLSLLPQFVSHDLSNVSGQLFALGVIFVLLSFLSGCLYVWGAGSLMNLLKTNPVVNLWKERVAGSIFAGLGAHLLFQTK